MYKDLTFFVSDFICYKSNYLLYKKATSKQPIEFNEGHYQVSSCECVFLGEPFHIR